MDWQEKLRSLAATQINDQETHESKLSEIVLGFMKEEVYPRLKAAQGGYIENGLEAEVSPELVEKISSDAASAGLSIQRKINGSTYKYSIYFERQAELNIDVKLDRSNGLPPVLGVFTLNRKPEPPTIFIEKYLNDFNEQFM